MIKDRRTDKVDLSMNDICRHTGVQLTDYDFVFYSKKTWQISLIAEKKHNSLTDGNDATVNLRENSIEMQRVDIGDKFPFAVVITYTKGNEQPVPAVFVIPYNKKCWNALYEFRKTRKLEMGNLWMSPRVWAQFVWFVTYGAGAVPADVVEEHNKLSDASAKYVLPRIICNYNCNCNCNGIYCNMTDKNNSSAELTDFYQKW
jgi:hypothetical protein